MQMLLANVVRLVILHQARRKAFLYRRVRRFIFETEVKMSCYETGCIIFAFFQQFVILFPGHFLRLMIVCFYRGIISFLYSFAFKCELTFAFLRI